MTKVQIVPAILAQTEEEYQQKLKKIEDQAEFVGGWVQIDLMDNKFVHNTTIGPEIISHYPTQLKKEVHLMVDYPESWIDQLVKVEAQRIILPVEDEAGMKERIKHIKNHDLEVGLALNPGTGLAKLAPFLEFIDCVLIMGVEPGFSGQLFLSSTLDKIKETTRLRTKNQLHFLIGVDGGIEAGNARQVAQVGADYLVIGSHLTDGNTAQNLEKIRQAFT